MNKTILWAARSFAILFVLMISMFALDIEKFSWAALFWHLWPALMLLIFLLIAWSRPKIGGVLWMLTALVYIVLTWSRVDWMNYLVVALPPFVIGLLFVLSTSTVQSKTASPSKPPTNNNQLNN